MRNELNDRNKKINVKFRQRIMNETIKKFAVTTKFISFSFLKITKPFFKNKNQNEKSNKKNKKNKKSKCICEKNM